MLSIEDELMGAAPQWLLSAFVRSCVAAGATAPRPQIEEAGTRLIAHWGEAGRFHHNVKHLVDVLAKVDQLAEETHHPDLVRLAAWFHGAVFSSAPTAAYAQRGGEDEVASASLAGAELAALGVPAEAVARVEHIIVGIARHRDARDVDTQALCDAELATLAVEPQKYAEYRRSVRKEYAHIPLRDYLTSRIAILGKLLARKSLFASPLGHPWEEPARQNLGAELQRLRDELAQLPEHDDGGLASAAPTTELPAVRTRPAPPTGGGGPASSLETTPAVDTGVLPAVAGRVDGRVDGDRDDRHRTAREDEPATESIPVIKRFERTRPSSARPNLPGRS